MIGMIRLACTNERAARLLQQFVAGEVLKRLAGSIDTEAQRRASVVGSQLVGLALMRHVVKIGPLASASRQNLAVLFARSFSTTSPATSTCPWRRQ